jgi:hypothetical protein
MKHIGLPLGWITGMIMQLIFFPIFWKAYNFNGIWWIVQLSGLVIATTIAIIWDRKVTFPWIKEHVEMLKAWITKQLGTFVVWLNK